MLEVRADDEGKQEQEIREEWTGWYGVWKEVKPVCAEFTVPLDMRLSCDAREGHLDERL